MGKPEQTAFGGMKHTAYRIALAGLAVAFGSMAASAETTVWIGGTSGSVFEETNWDNGVPHNNALIARFTNSVTFVADNKEKGWYVNGVELADGVTVTDNTRNNPVSSEDGQRIFDIGKGAKFVNTYVFYGKPELTLVKRGEGVLESSWCGSGNSRYKDVIVEGGTLYTHYSGANCRLQPYSNLIVRAGAEIKITDNNIVSTNGTLVTVDALGKINCNNRLQTWPGLEGYGIITNASKGVRLTLEHSGKVFSGEIHGKLIVHADELFASRGSYCVIGSANALADAELEIVDVEGFENPIRFAAGIGTFYVKKFPNRFFYDVNGVPVTLQRPGRQWYVDASRADEGTEDGLTEQTAFRTLKAAMENPDLQNIDTVLALPGVYSNSVMGSSTTLNRVVVPEGVHLISRDGAETTFIVGDIATNIVNDYGCGTGAVRCVYLKANSMVRGFTIMGGRVNPVQNSDLARGAGVFAADQTSFVVDCVLSNNVAWRGGAGHNGTWIRCKAYENRSTQIGAVWNGHCNLYNCVTDRNRGSYSYYSAANPVEVVNCVFGPNDQGSVRATGCEDGKRADYRNSVFLTAIQNADSKWESGIGSVFHRCIFAAGTDSDYQYDDDCIVTNISDKSERLTFVGLDENLKPLTPVSAVVDSGRADYYEVRDYEALLYTDLGGNARILGGNIDLGAYEYDWHLGAAYISADDGGLLVEGAWMGSNPVAEGEELTFTVKRSYDSEFPCVGFMTNGVFVSFDDYPNGWTWTVRGNDFSTARAIKAVYERSSDWYVDSVNGNDANKGYHINCPKQTLTDVMTNTSLRAGDTVWVAPGWYTNGVESSRENLYDQVNRVIVKAGVTLKSTHGSKVTFIAGAPSPEKIENADGCGPGAVRCVKLLSGAVISGFTLTNGFTSCMTGDKGYQKGPYGGGASGGRVEDCIIRNCTGVRGGGAADAVCIRCDFIDNRAAYIGSAANGGSYVNCFFSGNTEGSYTALNCDSIRNCTFLANNAQAVHYSTSTTPCNPQRVCNSLILCKGGITNAFSYCVFSKEGKTAAKWHGEGAKELAIAEMGLDDEGRPLSRTSAVVDVGDNNYAYASEEGASTDLVGSQRVYNGTIDIGCHEFDWRDDFARILSPSIVAVDSASPSVTAVAKNALRLSGNGSSMELHRVDSRCNRGSCSFLVKVSGAGTLSVFRDGAEEPWAEVTEVDCEASFSFRMSEPLEKLSFFFTGEGYADISKFTRHAGTVITVK